MSKIVISEQYGGFGLSVVARARLKELGFDDGGDPYVWPERDSPLLVQVVEELGDTASGRYAGLVVIEIPDGIGWHVHEYDGFESLHENHRTWQSDGVDDGC